MQSENPIAGCSRANSMITSDGAGWLSEFESATCHLSDGSSVRIPEQNLSTAAYASVYDYFAKKNPGRHTERGAPRPTQVLLPDRMLTGRN